MNAELGWTGDITRPAFAHRVGALLGYLPRCGEHDSIRGAQIQAVLSFSAWAVIANALNATIVITLLTGDVGSRGLFLWGAAMLGIVLLGIRDWAKSRPRSRRRLASPRGVRKITIRGFFLAVVWSVPSVFWLPVISSDKQLVVVTIVAGMICAGGFALATVPMAGISYVVTLAIGVSWGIAASGDMQRVALLALLLVYSFIVIVAVVKTGRLFGERFAIEGRLVEQAAQLNTANCRESQERKATEARRLVLEQIVASFASRMTHVEEVLGGNLTTTAAIAQDLRSSTASTKERMALLAVHSTTMEDIAANANSACVELSSSLGCLTDKLHEALQAIQTTAILAKQTDRAIDEFGEAADETGKVVAMATDIARQINLLALNATIEAARAGEAGRGFSAVANEFKNLAVSAGRSTEVISSRLAAMQASTQGSIRATRAIIEAVDRTANIADRIGDAAASQVRIVASLARSIDMVGAGTGRLTVEVGGLEVGVNAASSAADLAEGTLVGLAKVSRGIAEAVSDFLGKIETYRGLDTAGDEKIG